ncbi:MAG: peptidase M1, partial [Acidobacteria bacterium]|nr:peptidase M1 [Acidobacteriota bacterium]
MEASTVTIYTSPAMRRSILLLLLSSLPCLAAAPSGIPRELARERATLISNLHYALKFTLTAGASTTIGEEDLQFQLKEVRSLLLDYRGVVASLEINGHAASFQHENGHLVLTADELHVGENKIHVTFTSVIAPAGAAITSYKDHDDLSEYIYTLFVPMDASM